MGKYRKRPVIVEAVQLRWDTWGEMCVFADVGKLTDRKSEGCYIGLNGQPRTGNENSDRMGLLIPTLEGLMVAVQDDWIVKGVKGELYPVKPDIFAETYEEVV